MSNNPVGRLRQRVYAPYLAQTGTDHVDRAAFMAWLADHPENEAFALFYGTSPAKGDPTAS